MKTVSLATSGLGTTLLPRSRAGRIPYLLFVCGLLLLIGRNLYLRQQRQSLIEASRKGDVMAVRRLLKQGADPNARDGQGTQTLGVALHNKQAGAARAQDIYESVSGKTWLFRQSAVVGACDLGDADLVAAMFDRGASVPAEDQGEALMKAIYGGNLPILRLLLEHGCSPNSRLSWGMGGSTALRAAIDMRPVEMVRALLEAGANPNIPDGTGITPLQAARFRTSQRKEVIAVLQKAGARK